MAMSRGEREALVEQYARGPGRIREALARVPHEALQWRPAPGKWSVHEVVVHCADSETNAALRIRYLLQNPEAAREMGEKGHRHVLENFLLTRHLREYLTLMLALQRGGDGRIELHP